MASESRKSRVYRYIYTGPRRPASWLSCARATFKFGATSRGVEVYNPLTLLAAPDTFACIIHAGVNFALFGAEPSLRLYVCVGGGGTANNVRLFSRVAMYGDLEGCSIRNLYARDEFSFFFWGRFIFLVLSTNYI